MVKVLAFAGSTRQQSYNKSILKYAVEGAEQAGAEVTLIDLADYPMPIFNQDDEAESGAPESVKQFKALMMENDGLLIASPEYNSAYSALLKNTIDWASRMEEGERPLQAFKGKVVGIMAASPGALGGLRGLAALRTLLGNIGTLVLPGQKAVPKVNTLLNEQGELTDERTANALRAIGKETVETLQKLKP